LGGIGDENGLDKLTLPRSDGLGAIQHDERF
jgi:hypothetical protein